MDLFWRLRMSRFITLFALMTFLHCGAFAADSGEAALRAEFQKAYQKAEEKSRGTVYEMLKGSKEKATLDILLRVAPMEKLPENRLAAFKVLCSFDDTDTSVSQAAAQLFTQEKDVSTKAQMANAMTELRFKFLPLQALLAYYTTSAWSQPPTVDAPASQMALYEKAQANSLMVHESIGKLSGNSILFDKSSRTAYKKWWEQNQATFVKADQDLLKELKAAKK